MSEDTYRAGFVTFVGRPNVGQVDPDERPGG